MVGLGIVNAMKAALADKDGVAKIAAPNQFNHIPPLLLSSTEQSVPGLLPLVLPPQGQAAQDILRLEDPILVRSACCYAQSRFSFYHSSRPIPTIINLVRLSR